jgi:hypothetical protein
MASELAELELAGLVVAGAVLTPAAAHTTYPRVR